ncbi:MAG: prolyl oligopeptidase family serine peptidase [Bacteroidota bacterium]
MQRAIFIILFFSLSISAQNKRPLDHSDYDQWQKIEDQQISRSGNIVSYTVKAQEGDGVLEIYDSKASEKKIIKRGTKSKISFNENFVAAIIKAPYHTIRAEKKEGKKKLKLTQDSLKVWDIKKEKIIFEIPRVKEFLFPEEADNSLAFRKIPAKENKDEEEKAKTFELGVINLSNSKTIDLKHVSDYAFDKTGEYLYVIRQGADSIVKSGVYSLNLNDFKYSIIDTLAVHYKKLSVFDAKTISYISSKDSLDAENIKFNLNLLQKSKTVNITSYGLKKGWIISEYQKPEFSENGLRLFFGLQKERPLIEKDTLLEDEKAKVDVWHYKDGQLQSEQEADKKKIKEKSFLAVYHIKSKKIVQLADEDVDEIILDKKKNLLSVIGLSNKKYRIEKSFNFPWNKDLYSININNGLRRKVFEGIADKPKLSPFGNYATVFSRKDSSWYNIDLKKGKPYKLTSNTNKSRFYDEENDIPSPAEAYGKAYWSRDEKYLIINDRYDLWRIHPKNSRGKVNITDYFGFRNKIRFRYLEVEKEEEYIPENGIFVLHGFSETTKDEGIYLGDITKNNPWMKFEDEIRVSKVIKAKEANAHIFLQESFYESPNIYLAKTKHWTSTKLSDLNPQQKNFKWGSVDLISWKSYSNKPLEGLLYYPADFNPAKKYPMIIYFYEIYSDRKNKYYPPSPSRSIVNFSYLTSNDYLVFVPDIKYNIGQPGQDAFDAVMSGVEKVEEFQFVDSENMAIQGQSWGGYQVAYLVTQTNKFKCAMAGAPVSNMTSAYGGIRWKSGLSREFQYEKTQSRLGKDLWKGIDLYIDNSPLFMAPKVKTPLLMMHNDNDGAVPYYQGIEYFMALRRLGKPAWLLIYNDEEHNLKKRKNMKDLTVRMYQFFDHYLKNAPAPKWLIEGVPYIDKGKDYGYKLLE